MLEEERREVRQSGMVEILTNNTILWAYSILHLGRTSMNIGTLVNFFECFRYQLVPDDLPPEYTDGETRVRLNLPPLNSLNTERGQ